MADSTLLEVIQGDWELVARPYEAMARRVGITEREFIIWLEGKMKEGIVREVALIYDARRLGFASALVAMEAPGEVATQVLRECEDVSHAYLRDFSPYNVWFTVVAPSREALERRVAFLAEEMGAGDYHILYVVKEYKLRMYVRMAPPGSAKHEKKHSEEKDKREREPVELDGTLRRVVEVAQGAVPLVERPFAVWAEQLSMGEEELLACLRKLKAGGYLRRFSAVLRHTQAGYRANALVAWAADDIETAGRTLASHPMVSHCYWRESHKGGWHLPLFSMVHGYDEQNLRATLDELKKNVPHRQVAILPTVKEIRKERPRLKFESGILT